MNCLSIKLYLSKENNSLFNEVQQRRKNAITKMITSRFLQLVNCEKV